MLDAGFHIAVLPISAGAEGSLGTNFGLDVRVRYNLIFGEVNPLTAWDLHKSFPISTIDAGVSIKYYFD